MNSSLCGYTYQSTFAFACNAKSFATAFLVFFFSFSFLALFLDDLTNIFLHIFDHSLVGAPTPLANMLNLVLIQTLYLHCCNTYGHQTWQVYGIKWERPIHKVTCFFNHMVLFYLVIRYTIFSTRPMITKHQSLCRLFLVEGAIFFKKGHL